MKGAAADSTELQQIYRRRFEKSQSDRAAVWRVLTSRFFSQFVKPSDAVLDLGSGYAEFINHIAAARKFAMDLNPDSAAAVASDVTFLQQDCSQRWALEDGSLDAVFTSNFFEHLPDKDSLGRTLGEAARCLRTGGRLIAMGPNIARVGGAYWHFWDHHIALTEQSLSEVLRLHAFEVERAYPAFLPYTIGDVSPRLFWLLPLYLRLPIAWRFFGGQFLVVARKRN
ncbi:MAG TPA: class I SAM-dependent methyltransferase [Chthoniobacterales bacterium]|jgi:SAM-dependent methyltransferase